MTTLQDTTSRFAGQARSKTSGWDWGFSGGRFHFTTPAGSDYELRSPVAPTKDTPLMIVAKGAAAGLVGTAFITVLMQGARSLMGEEAYVQPTPMKEQGGGRHTEPREEVVERVATGVAERPISSEQRETLATGLHWLYGSFWGTVYGLVQTTLHVPTAIHGTILGLAVWGVGPLSLFPAMKLTPPPTEAPASRTFLTGAVHLVYGWVTAYTFRLLSKDPEV